MEEGELNVSEEKSEYTQETLDTCTVIWIRENVYGMSVLDIGCGSGGDALFLAQEGKHVLGMDYDREQICEARRTVSNQAEAVSGSVKFVCSDFLDYDFNTQTFDSIILSNVLHESSDPYSILEKAEKLLTPLGKLIVTFPLVLDGSEKNMRVGYIGELYGSLLQLFQPQRIQTLGSNIGIICEKKDCSTSDNTLELNAITILEAGFLERECRLRNKLNDVEATLSLLQSKSKKLQRSYTKLKEEYNEIKTSKLGRLQLWYWHSRRWPARFARTIYRGIKGVFLRKRNRVEELSITQPKQLPIVQPVPTIGKSAILFMVTNGAGLGHLTRSMAIARRIVRMDPEQEIIFITTSAAINLLHRENFEAYHIPSRSSLSSEMTAAQWGKMLLANLNQLFSLYNISTVVFDGAYPYAPFVNSITSHAGLEKVWVKRGSDKPEAVEARLQLEKHFDHIILPGEAGAQLPVGDSHHIGVAPIVYIDKEELLTREQVRTLFKIPDGTLFVYLQLGAGYGYDLNSRLSCVIDVLREKGNIMIAIGESPIGESLQMYEEDIIVIKDYPNSRYFNGFDYVISACGYNTFHELMYFGIPTMFLPTAETGVDDQLSRARLGERAGVAIVVDSFDKEKIRQAVDLLSDSEENHRMRANASKISFLNGADDAARSILALNQEARKAKEGLKSV